MFYSKSTGGFYDSSIHGTPTMSIIDPVWVRPMTEIPDPNWIASDHPEGTPVPLVNSPDMSIEGPTVIVNNPASLIPADAVEITDAEHAALLNAQSMGRVIEADALGMPIAVDPPKPTAAQVWELIKAERDRRTDLGGYKVGTKWFHSDQKSRSQQLGLVLLGSNIPANTPWKTMDGSFVTMTQTLAGQILAAAAASDIAIFAAAETHKAAMEAAADPAAYDFSVGWPKVYGEV